MVIIGSDHTGIDLKYNIIKYLEDNKIKYIDVTNKNTSDDDYPDIAKIICNNVLKNDKNYGIAICGTGIGISISCNKLRGIRAALCTDEYMSEMSRRHNNSNVLCLGARLDSSKNMSKIQSIVQAFLNTEYENGRHDRRLSKIVDLEKEGGK